MWPRGQPGRRRLSRKRGVVAAATMRPAISASVPRCQPRPPCAFAPSSFSWRRDLRSTGRRAADRRDLSPITELIEPLSLDEAYLDVSGNRRGLPTAWATAKDIRARIFAETGLTASAGISYNKFLAKLASDLRKPNGQFAITPEMGPAFVETLPVAKFHGVGPVTAAKMQRLGIITGRDLRAQPLYFLRRRFWKIGRLVSRHCAWRR